MVRGVDISRLEKTAFGAIARSSIELAPPISMSFDFEKNSMRPPIVTIEVTRVSYGGEQSAQVSNERWQRNAAGLDDFDCTQYNF